MSMSGGKINDTELVASLIDQKDSLVDGLLYAQERIQGSMSMLLLTPEASTPPGTATAVPPSPSARRTGRSALPLRISHI